MSKTQGYKGGHYANNNSSNRAPLSKSHTLDPENNKEDIPIHQFKEISERESFEVIKHAEEHFTGKIVEIETLTNERIVGVLFAVSDKGDLAMKMCAIFPAENNKDKRIVKKDLLTGHICKVRSISLFESDKKTQKAFNTDKQIATGEHVSNKEVSREKDLVPFAHYMENTDFGLVHDLEGKTLHGFDPEEMFRINKDKFGVTTTFDPDMKGYTVQIDTNHPDYEERKRDAERIAQEIESSKSSYCTSSKQDDSEETRYSSVNRSSSIDKHDTMEEETVWNLNATEFVPKCQNVCLNNNNNNTNDYYEGIECYGETHWHYDMAALNEDGSAYQNFNEFPFPLPPYFYQQAQLPFNLPYPFPTVPVPGVSSDENNSECGSAFSQPLNYTNDGSPYPVEVSGSEPVGPLPYPANSPMPDYAAIYQLAVQALAFYQQNMVQPTDETLGMSDQGYFPHLPYVLPSSVNGMAPVSLEHLEESTCLVNDLTDTLGQSAAQDLIESQPALQLGGGSEDVAPENSFHHS